VALLEFWMYRSTTITYRITEAFFRNRRLFFLAFVLVSVVTMTALYLRSKTYTATALTQVITDNVAQALGEQQTNDWVSPAQKNVNQLDVLLNGDFLSAALANIHLQKPINTDPQANDPRLALLRKKLDTSVQSDTLFAITLTWDNPADATQIVGAVQQQYIQEIGQERYAQTNATLAFLDSQIADYAGRLRQSEKTLTDYKTSNIGQLPDAQNASSSELQSLQAELETLETTSDDATRQKAVLQQELTQIKPLAIAAQTATASPLQAQINQLKAQRDALLVTMLPTHPKVQALDQQIAALQSQANSGASETQQVLRTTLEQNPEWQTLHQQLIQATVTQQTQADQIQKLKQQIASYQKTVAQIPSEQRHLTDVTRDYTVIQAQYDTLLQRREQVQLEGNLARVSASSSLSPIGYIHAEATTGKAKLIVMFLGSLILGLIVGLALVVLCEWSDHSLRYGSDAVGALGVPVLAVVPDAAQLRVIPIGNGVNGGGGSRKRLAAPKMKHDMETATPALEAPLGSVPVMSASAVEGAQ
jgi:polysaccharide chain length determinant protein (PEP-CTERM system associated)